LKGGEKMAKFLDLRTSQNASYANSISVPITVINDPQLIGRIGLATQDAGSNIRVLLQGTVTLQLPLVPVATTVNINIVRGTSPNSPSVYSATQSMNLSIVGPQVFTVNALDFNPAAAVQLTYSMYVSVTALGVTRVGPESFSGVAASD
jgi:hypothetical protein